ncbi:hypothetical protein THAOC_07840 [Thalassiosira oceanica]|uniref:Cyclin N-terminal domain-containing protein n=1 Tax=Thalassiosira oceanica TaxID=159749 RepID=K0SWK4_THAOC|nr:hypothetical protein THAOC_07840 [Thalassiosira oceanica]|eukprot:EJK70773.1 hypothetical protein THAOC_07840 [Thalassiosira oceanica]
MLGCFATASLTPLEGGVSTRSRRSPDEQQAGAAEADVRGERDRCVRWQEGKTDGRPTKLVDEGHPAKTAWTTYYRRAGSEQTTRRQFRRHDDNRIDSSPKFETRQQGLMNLMNEDRRIDSQLPSYGPTGGISCEILRNMAKSERDIYDPKLKFDYSGDNHVNNFCRVKMIDWIDRMSNFFNLSDGVTTLALNIIDRFLETALGEEARNDRRLYRNVSVTALYVAMKIVHPEQWNISTLKFANLINDTVSSDQLEILEERILFGLGWYVNPAATSEYCERLLQVISNEENENKNSLMRRTSSHDCVVDISSIESLSRKEWLRRNRSRIDELIHLQMNAALRDHNFIQVKSSCIAAAAIVNALNILGEADFSQTKSPYYTDCVDRIEEVSLDCDLSSDAELKTVGGALLKLLLRDAQ